MRGTMMGTRAIHNTSPAAGSSSAAKEVGDVCNTRG